MSNFVQNLSTALKPFAPHATDHLGYEKHKERPSQKRQNQQNKNNEEEVQGVTGTYISTQAAILFLEDFLEHKLNAKLQNESHSPSSNSSSSWINKTYSNENTKAAKIYQATHSNINKRYFAASRNPEIHGNIKEVYQVLQKLRSLKDRGILTIEVREEERFIDSIWNAVQKL